MDKLAANAVFVMAFIVGFAVAVGSIPKFIIHTVPHSKSSSSVYTYAKPVAEYNNPPASPPSSAYEQSSGNSGSSSSSGSSYADPTACTSDGECEAVDVNAECRYNKCQCKAPFVPVDVGLSPSSTTMSMRAAEILDNRAASTVYLPPPTTNVTCVLPFALRSGQTCLVEQSCCLTAAEQARLDASSACKVAPVSATLAAFNAPKPKVSYRLPNAPPGVSINAASGAITINASSTGSSVTVTVQATLSSDPIQVATTTVTLLVSRDPCCARAPAQLQRTVDFDLLTFLFDNEFLGIPVSEFVLIDFSGNTVPKLGGTALSELFSDPCDKPIRVVSAALAPVSTDANNFCQFLVIENNNQLMFQASAEDPTTFSDALFEAIYVTGTLSDVTADCALNVVVASCNGNRLAATVNTSFTITAGGVDALADIIEQMPQQQADANDVSHKKKSRKNHTHKA